MNFRLFPLIAVIALPTAVNAFPFGNDVQIENTVGEKILIKGKTVSTKNLNKGDLINLIDINIAKIKKNIEWDNKQIKWYEKMFKEYGRDYYIQGKNEQLGWLKEKETKISKLLEKKSSIIKDVNNSDLIHVVSIDFTPVYIDLNNQKRVGAAEKIYCLNPLLVKEKIDYQQTWLDQSSDSEKELFKNGLLLEKVCKKYAKF